MAENFGIIRPTLYNWKNQLLGPEAPATLKRRNTAPSGAAPEREKLERQFETLQRAIRQLPIAHDLLKKANELIRKDLGADLQTLSNRPRAIGPEQSGKDHKDQRPKKSS